MNVTADDRIIEEKKDRNMNEPSVLQRPRSSAL